jgi:uncharacterized protein YndB with AHSA1/START domain
MPVTETSTDVENLTLTLVAEFAAPVDRVWRAFTDPRQLERFWGPPGWPASFTEFDFAVGGRASYAMTSPRGESSRGQWEFLSIDEGTGFAVLDSFVDEDGGVVTELPSMRVTYAFEETADGCRMRNVTYFPSAEGLEQAVEMGAVEGSTMAINQLDAVLQDLRDYAQGKGTQLTLLDDTHVQITRLIDGPRDLVWRAHQDPELMRQWMLGPDGWSMTVCEVDLTVGGEYRYAWEQDGAPETAFGFEGETVLSEAPWRAVTTERMTGTDGPGTLNDLQLYEEDGATLITVFIEYPDRETRDTILETGMVDGMETSYARLEKVIAA